MSNLFYNIDLVHNPSAIYAYCLVNGCMAYAEEDFEKCLALQFLIKNETAEGGYEITQKGLQAIENYLYAMPECICEKGKVFRFYDKGPEDYWYHCHSCGKFYQEANAKNGCRDYAVDFGHIEEVQSFRATIDTANVIKNAPAIQAPDKPNVFATSDKKENDRGPGALQCPGCGKNSLVRRENLAGNVSLVCIFCKIEQEEVPNEGGYIICPSCYKNGNMRYEISENLWRWRCIRCNTEYEDNDMCIGGKVETPSPTL